MDLTGFERLARDFEVHLSAKEHAVMTIRGGELSDPVRLTSWLNDYGPLIKTEDIQAAAAYFCSWLASLALAFKQALVMTGHAPDFALERLTLQASEEKTHRIAFIVHPWTAHSAPNQSDMYLATEQFYSETLRPVFDAMAVAAGIHARQLWGQITFLVRNMMMGWLNAPDLEEDQRDRLRDLYYYVTQEIPAAAFHLKRNPFQQPIRTAPGLVDPNARVPLRDACCIRFRIEGASYCYNCPRLTDQARSELGKTYLASMH